MSSGGDSSPNCQSSGDTNGQGERQQQPSGVATTQPNQGEVHEVFGDPQLGGVMLVLLLLHLMQVL
jgi:hypothetical protein